MTTTTTTPNPNQSTAGIARRTAVGSMILWGLLHVVGGIVLIAQATGSGSDAIAAYATALPPVDLSGPASKAVTGLVGFHGFNIAAAGAAVTTLAWIRRRDARSHWRTPLTVAAVADIGLVAFLLIPGVMATADGAPGLVLLLVALAAASATDRG